MDTINLNFFLENMGSLRVVYFQTGIGSTDGRGVMHASLAFQTSVGVVGAAVDLWVVEEVVVTLMYNVRALPFVVQVGGGASFAYFAFATTVAVFATVFEFFQTDARTAKTFAGRNTALAIATTTLVLGYIVIFFVI